MAEICEATIPQLQMDFAVFVVHANESRLSINEDDAHGIGYTKVYRALLQATVTSTAATERSMKLSRNELVQEPESSQQEPTSNEEETVDSFFDEQDGGRVPSDEIEESEIQVSSEGSQVRFSIRELDA
ncbi:hypothetical protein OS493_031748 [Desmophyllum pertusum]|uniref:Uncharacterized protein n=1 Tax=Desmophyllum pertusum TaxID=174260 RepID=A0A9W9Z8Q6_9CNID|nr:hypothetical protein OS493_031748 [Desmophyllum pertusum]